MELQNEVSVQGGDMGQTEGKFLTFWTAGDYAGSGLPGVCKGNHQLAGQYHPGD